LSIFAFRVFNYIALPEEAQRYTTELWNIIANGKLKVKIHKEYSFTVEGVQQSHKDIVGRGTVGKLLIKVA